MLQNEDIAIVSVSRGPLSFPVSQAIVEERNPANVKWHE